MDDPLSSLKLLESATLISQGAEAKVYRGSLTPEGEQILLKYRFKKKYRHATLDTSLTKSRVSGEARALLKCLRHGVNVPGIRMVDAPAGLLGIDWIDGTTIKYLLPRGSDGEEGDECISRLPEAKTLHQFGITTGDLMNLIGIEIAKMHQADIIHGDLTTSNMILRSPQNTAERKGTELVLIDFGLSYHSSLVEDKAVDLFVLERAFASTHPDFEPFFASVLSSYAEMLKKDWPPVQRRLDDVRLRGRKRSMVG